MQNRPLLVIQNRLLLLALVIALVTVVVPASAVDYAAIPSTPDEVHDVAHDALADGVIQYMRAAHLGEKIAHPDAATLRESWTYYPEYPRRTVDSAGKEVTLYKPLKRIVAYHYHWVYPLGAGDIVVGVAGSAVKKDAVIYPLVTSKVDVGGGGPNEPDLERIFACDPDVVLTYTKLGPGPEFFEEKLPKSVQVIRFDFNRPEMLREEMLKLGYLLNRTENAQAYVVWSDHLVNEIKRRVAEIPEDERVRVFIDKGAGQTTDRRSATTGERMHELCTDAGGINVAENHAGKSGTVNVEWIMQQNPDVILGQTYSGGYATNDYAPLVAHHDELATMPVLQDVQAVKNDRVYCISYKFGTGPSYPAALATTAKWFYPERFTDIDPAAIHQDYIDTFLNVDYSVADHGVFGHPGEGP